MRKKRIFKILLIVLLFYIGATVSVYSQYSYYYGKSKVIKTGFKWKYIETPNFKIFHYTDDIEIIKKIAIIAENAYDRISKFLNIEVSKKIPIIFYNTHVDFEQTNIFPGFMPAGVEAFAEPVNHRIVLHGDSSFTDTSRTLVHELGHIFEYEIIYKKSSRSVLSYNKPPLWVMEGFSEFITRDWRSFSLLTVRDAAISDQIPEVKKNGMMKVMNATGRAPYDFGHMVYDFIEHKFGSRGVRNLLYSYRGRLIGRKKNIFRNFGVTENEFNFELGKYVRKKFKSFITKESPDDYSYRIGPNFPFVYSFSHNLSPSGEILAIVTANIKNRKLDIILISMKDGKMIKNITPGFTSKYDGISIVFNPENGKTFTWDSSGDNIAFFARKEYTNYLVLMDVLKNRIIKRIKLTDIQEPSSPDFDPAGKKVYFTGVKNSRSFIFIHDLTTGKTEKITRGRLYIRSIDISPLGDKIVFSAQIGKFYHLFYGSVNDPESAIKLTSGDFNNITPSFSKDSKRIYFSSDEKGSYNIYSVDMNERVRYCYTDVKTGNFYPEEIPGDKNSVVISSFYKGRFSLYRKKLDKYLAKDSVDYIFIKNRTFKKESVKFSKSVEEKFGKSVKPETKFSFKDGKVIANRSFDKGIEEELNFNLSSRKKYKPFKNLFIPSLPPIMTGFGSDGSIFGYSHLQLSDLMGDYNFSLFAASFYGYRSYSLSYINLRQRLQFFTQLYYFADSYFTPSSYVDAVETALMDRRNYITVRKRFGLTAGFHLPFSRDYRAEFSFSLHHQDERIDDIFYGGPIPFGQFFDGYAFPVSVSFVGETTRFSYFGPTMGHTFKVSFQKYFRLGKDFLDSYSVDFDVRKYFRLATNTVFAVRLNGFHSGGKFPILYWTGGNNTIRASAFRSLTGNNGFIFSSELRFPLINFMSTPIGIMGPIRGVFFFDLGGVWLDRPIFSDSQNTTPVPKFKFFSDNFVLEDPISSYGFGLELNLFGYPTHFEWVYRTNLKESNYYGFKFWIGFDF